jgi:hypothetical protein
MQVAVEDWMVVSLSSNSGDDCVDTQVAERAGEGHVVLPPQANDDFLQRLCLFLGNHGEQNIDEYADKVSIEVMALPAGP